MQDDDSEKRAKLEEAIREKLRALDRAREEKRRRQKLTDVRSATKALYAKVRVRVHPLTFFGPYMVG